MCVWKNNNKHDIGTEKHELFLNSVRQISQRIVYLHQAPSEKNTLVFLINDWVKSSKLDAADISHMAFPKMAIIIRYTLGNW